MIILIVKNSIVKMNLFACFAIIHDALGGWLSMFLHMECCVSFMRLVIVSAPAAAELGQ